MMGFLRREWAMLSTKFGMVIAALATVAPQFAQFDPRIAWIGGGAGVLLMLYREKPAGDPPGTAGA